jgi:hypothetical protein
MSGPNRLLSDLRVYDVHAGKCGLVFIPPHFLARVSNPMDSTTLW